MVKWGKSKYRPITKADTMSGNRISHRACRPPLAMIGLFVVVIFCVFKIFEQAGLTSMDVFLMGIPLMGAYSAIAATETDVNSPVNQTLMDKIRDNIDYLYEHQGWHGSNLSIKVAPNEFLPAFSTIAYNFNTATMTNTTGTTQHFQAHVFIPVGYKATALTVYGSNAANTVSVNLGEINDGITATSLGTGVVGTGINITDTAWSSSNYIAIDAYLTTTDSVYGAVVAIERI